PGRPEQLDDALLQIGRSRRAEETGDAWNDAGIEMSDTEEVRGDLGALIVEQRRVPEPGGQLGNDRFQIGRQRAGLVPTRDEWQRRAGQTRPWRADQGL